MRGVVLVTFGLLVATLTGCSTGAGGSTTSPEGQETVEASEPTACILPQPPLDDAAQEVADKAMPEDEFWGLIDLLGGTTDEAGFAALTAELAQRDVDTILAFDARLTVLLYSLDYSCRADWYLANDPIGAGYLGDDGFLYARGDTISAGRENYEQAIAEGTLPWGTVDPTLGYGELLLYVGMDAAAQLGVDFDAYLESFFTDVPISYETGSNPGGGW